MDAISNKELFPSNYGARIYNYLTRVVNELLSDDVEKARLLREINKIRETPGKNVNQVTRDKLLAVFDSYRGNSPAFGLCPA